MVKSPLKRKLKDLKYKYGELAVEYFLSKPVCEVCGEERLVVLNIHHVHGKKVNEFKTLCFNCHMIEHNPSISNVTYSSCKDEELKLLKKTRDKEQEILESLNNGIPLRNIIVRNSTCIKTIHKVMDKYGFVSVPRKGYIKKADL